MSGDSSRRRDKRAIPCEDLEGEEAYNIAVRQVSLKKSTPKRGRGSGNISGDRGSLTGQHLEDNGGREGKTIPIEVNKTIRLGEIDSSYLVHSPLFPKKRPPTKYDSSLQLEYQSYEGTSIQVKLAREENPYSQPKHVGIDKRFWSLFHYSFYSSVCLSKPRIRKMQLVDWQHFENFEKPEVEDVLEVVDKFHMKDLMGFKYDWNAEIIARFHATFYYDSHTNIIHWMTEGVHYKIDFVTFARLLGFGKTYRERDTIYFENHLKNHQIAYAYILDEMAQGITLGLKPMYYVLNNLIRQTIYPKGGSDSTSLRGFAPNLIAKLLPGAAPFSVSKFMWYDLITSMDNGVDNFPYAPYVMYIIELVTGYIFKKDCEHCSYQVK
jgi:hypothetical protein